MSLKTLILAPAVPLARLSRSSDSLRRVWAFARLQSAVQHRVPRSVVVLGAPDVHGTGNISLGESLYLYRELHLETQASGRIEIGDRVVLSRGVHIVSFASIHIGSGSLIGEYTSLRDANHRLGPAVDIRDSGHDARPIHIGNNVWIGRGVTVLPGVTIGDHAVIGANAVVTHDVPAGEVVAGVPARPLPLRRAA